jgi:2-isopropylmalate synthase
VIESSALAYLEVVNRVASRKLRDRLKPTDSAPLDNVPGDKSADGASVAPAK